MATTPTNRELVDHVSDAAATRIALGALAILVPPIGLLALALHTPRSRADSGFRRRWLWVAAVLTAILVAWIVFGLAVASSTGTTRA
jgi:hypothetical protein